MVGTTLLTMLRFKESIHVAFVTDSISQRGQYGAQQFGLTSSFTLFFVRFAYSTVIINILIGLVFRYFGAVLNI
jgi:hypothetical protein